MRTWPRTQLFRAGCLTMGVFAEASHPETLGIPLGPHLPGCLLCHHSCTLCTQKWLFLLTTFACVKSIPHLPSIGLSASIYETIPSCPEQG